MADVAFVFPHAHNREATREIQSRETPNPAFPRPPPPPPTPPLSLCHPCLLPVFDTVIITTTTTTAIRAAFQATAVEADLVADSLSAHRAAAAAAAVEGAALVYGDPPTAVTFAEAFLQDGGDFFRAMDAVSHGRFFRDTDFHLADVRRGSKAAALDGFSRRKGGAGLGLAAAMAATAAAGGGGGLRSISRGGAGGGGSGGGRGVAAGGGPGGEGWAQCPWLRSMGGFRLAAFLANR